MSSEVEATVKEISARILHKPELEFTGETTFKSLGADSLDIVQILVAIEDKYNIELEDEELQKVSNIKDFVAYVESKIAKKGK
jgi:acyl carrier protein